MTPLRQRFVDDLRLRNYAPRTIKSYVAGVVRLARYYGRSPDRLGAEEIRAFQLDLLRRRVSWSLFNQTVCALRVFFGVTLNRPDVVTMIPYGKRPRTVPVVLSPEETLRFLEAVRPGRDRVLLQTAYACGLRLGEVTHLRVADIDSARRVIVVRRGKGQKDRLVPLSPRLLEVLRAYWLTDRPRGWLFPGRDPARPLNETAIQKLCQRVVTGLGLAKRVTPHTLRHSFATHMLEAGVDVRTVQAILGHTDLTTTANYLHVGTHRFRQLPGLLDRLMLPAAEVRP